MNIINVEEHSSVLWHLKKLNVKNCMFYHFDAHIDIAHIENSITNRICSSQSLEELKMFEEEVWYKNKGSKGYHCGNFLYLAISMGIISTFVWIIPNEEKRSAIDIFKKVVTKIGGVKEREFADINYNNKIISVKLYGINIKVVTLKELSKLKPCENTVVDIDIDFMFNLFNKLNWIDPKQFIKSIRPMLDSAENIFICKSVISGHTPKIYEFFAEYILDLINKRDSNVYEKKRLAIENMIFLNNFKNIQSIETDSISKILLTLNSFNKPLFSSISNDSATRL